MTASSGRTTRTREAAAEPAEPVSYVYCKGCGTQLGPRDRVAKPRVVVDSMMCEPCQREHNHALAPTPGAPTYCYRCGTLEETFVTPGISPATYHVCPQCLPDRVGRYREGDFEEPPKVVPEEAAKA